MEQNIIDSIMYEVNQLIRKGKISNAKIEYVLVNKENSKNSIALVSDNTGKLYEIFLQDNKIMLALDWAYNVDNDIFLHLENEYEIGYMNIEFHFNIWGQFKDWDIDDVESKLGFQKYLKYCKENKIDRNIVCDENDINIPDIMQYYNEKTDYMKIENGQVQMTQEKYQKESEVNYIVFCLGYDLINEMLSKSEVSECDTSYDFCDYLARTFIETDYYKNERKSTYDNLQEWINENKDIIKSEFLQYNAIDYKIILETTKRNDMPIALVEIAGGQPNEYVIAFNYKFTNKNLELGYAYYYDNDLNKAKEDFEKVKAGGNLADTFKLQTNVNDEVKETVENKKEFIEQVIKKQNKSKERER